MKPIFTQIVSTIGINREFLVELYTGINSININAKSSAESLQNKLLGPIVLKTVKVMHCGILSKWLPERESNVSSNALAMIWYAWSSATTLEEETIKTLTDPRKNWGRMLYEPRYIYIKGFMNRSVSLLVSGLWTQSEESKITWKPYEEVLLYICLFLVLGTKWNDNKR